NTYEYVVRLLDTATGKELRQLKGAFEVNINKAKAGHCKLFAAGNRLLVLDGHKLRDLTADNEIGKFDSKGKEFREPFALSPDGRLLVGQIGTTEELPPGTSFARWQFKSAGLRLWDVTTG